jgi:arabinofuranan 3-O-arabinosyltransferase
VGSSLGITEWRRICAGGGIAALLALGFLKEGPFADRLALAAFILLAVAVGAAWLEFARGARSSPKTNELETSHASWQWLLVVVVVTVLAGAAIQTWFRPGTAIGLGDAAMPGGFAWIERLLEPWVWTGFNAGEPSQLPLELPRAAVSKLVQLWGGDASVAQRAWYTLLYVGAALGAVGLMWALRFGPVAAFVGASVYVLNPAMVSEVEINPVFLAALCPMVALPAAIVAVGTGRLPIRWAAAIVTVLAPLVGYVFFNPPLIGMVLAAMVGSPLLVGFVYGRAAATRSLLALALGLLVLLAVSAYWIVPAFIHLAGFTGSHLAPLASWAFTERRASLRNGFWLNTAWGWTYTEFYPFASSYESFPLSILRFVLPAIAFVTLALNAGSQANDQSLSRPSLLRLSVTVATIALFVILLSNGTNSPGNLVFIPLYNLPFGWLLREPGRFLLLAAAMYAVMVAVVIEALTRHVSWRTALKSPRLAPSWRLASVPVALGTAILLGFPIYTGAEIPNSRPGLPTGHVTMPAYWPQMATFVDSAPIEGNLLVLPPDDFYGMPYTWGYYGADSFIPELFRRHVLVPNPQGSGYVPTAPQLIGAVELVGQAILQHKWQQAAATAGALNAPLILVRGDIQSAYPGRTIMPPDALGSALATAPNFVLIHRVGLLELFELAQGASIPGVHSNFVTVDSPTPDLRVLSLLGPDDAIVSHRPQAGLTSLTQAPSLADWPVVANNLIWRPSPPRDASYELSELESQTTFVFDRPGAFYPGVPNTQVEFRPDSIADPITVSVGVRQAIVNGDFSAGPWGPVSDCSAVGGSGPKPSSSAQVVDDGPGGTRAMHLTAFAGTACVNQPITWRGGSIVLRLMVNQLRGSLPRLCLWEVGPQRCATMPAVSGASGWSTFGAALTPDSGTTALTLYLYADGRGASDQTISEYASAQVMELPELPTFDLIARPNSDAGNVPHLIVFPETFSDAWQGSNGTHVLVDGMFNGWLTTAPQSFSARYEPADAIHRAQILSVVAVLLLTSFLIGFEGRLWRARCSSVRKHIWLRKLRRPETPSAMR